MNKKEQEELCIICFQEKPDQSMKLGTCQHREFCTTCCIRYFEKEKYNKCPRCNAKVGKFVICSTKSIKVQHRNRNRKISQVF